MEKSKASRHATVNRIQSHQTSFTTNAKGISLGQETQDKKKTYKKINLKQLRKW